MDYKRKGSALVQFSSREPGRVGEQVTDSGPRAVGSPDFEVKADRV